MQWRHLLGTQNNTEGEKYIVEATQLLDHESSVAIMANVGDTLLLEGENDTSEYENIHSSKVLN